MYHAYPRDSEDLLLCPLLGTGFAEHDGYTRRKSQYTEPEGKGKESKSTA